MKSLWKEAGLECTRGQSTRQMGGWLAAASPRWRMLMVQKLTTWYLELSDGRQARLNISCTSVKEWRGVRRTGSTGMLTWYQWSFARRVALVQPKTCASTVGMHFGGGEGSAEDLGDEQVVRRQRGYVESDTDLRELARA